MAENTPPLDDQEDDFFILPDGRLVMTASYLRKRGYCCGSGCLNCPYEYINVMEPKRSLLLNQRRKND